MEGSQYGFRAHRGVQIVVQRAHWVQQQAMKESGTLIRIDLDFKNAFNSTGHSCLWAILRGLGGLDVDFLEDLYSKSWMKITVGTGSLAPTQLDTGTVQGSVLSPLLFDLFRFISQRPPTFAGRYRNNTRHQEDPLLPLLTICLYTCAQSEMQTRCSK